MASSARHFANRCRSLMAAKNTSTAASATISDGVATAAASSVKPRGRPLGILKPQPISPVFQKFIGASEVSRSDAVKKVWDYIKLKQLQNPENKREIFCDEKLKAIFGKEKVGFLEISSLISKHFQKSG